MSPTAPTPADCCCSEALHWRRIAKDAAAEVARLKAILEGKEAIVASGVRYIDRQRDVKA